MIQELDSVALTRGLADYRLEAGDIGTVVMVHGSGDAFEVEFATLGGDTITVATLSADAVRPLGLGEISHAREWAAGA